MARPPLHLIVYPSLMPVNSSCSREVRISIPYAHLNHPHIIQVPESLYLGAAAAGKTATIPSGCGDAWLSGYYKAMVQEPNHAGFYPILLAPFRKIRSDFSLDSDRYLELLVAYVKSLPYDTEKLASITIAPRFPVETVVDGKGICSDKSILLAGMLVTEGYAVALLHFSKENHLAVGIPAPSGFDFLNTGYAVIETTAVSYIGGDPCTESPTVSRPKVIPIGNGTRTYSAIRDTAHIHAVIRELVEKLKPDGLLTAELTRLQKTITSQTEELRKIKHEIEEEINPDRAKELDVRAQNKLQVLQRTIHQYNALSVDYTHSQELMGFIHANRLDRPAVIKRIYREHQ